MVREPEFCSIPNAELRANDVPTFLVRTSNAKNGTNDVLTPLVRLLGLLVERSSVDAGVEKEAFKR